MNQGPPGEHEPQRNRSHGDWPLQPRSRHGQHDIFSTRLIVGLLIILLGSALLADNLGWFDARHVLRSLWPLALVAVGVAMVRHPQHKRSRSWGWVLITVGVWIFLDKIGWIHVSLGQLILPGILLFVGGVLVFRSLSGPPAGGANPSSTAGSTGASNGTANSTAGPSTSPGSGTSFGGSGPTDQAEFVRSFAMLSGHELRPVSRPFRGADLNAIMGGIKLDLSSARMEGDTAVIEVFAFWGGVEIYVPPDWTVTSEVTTLLAGFIDKRRPTSVVPSKHLVIKGMVVMAGVEIKN
ncbi:MAG: DUF5668 domain-containing protein [Pseudomonadota bacterium]|nr:DUF5668 domain-containing protein [Pseudomonadota bacterium]